MMYSALLVEDEDQLHKLLRAQLSKFRWDIISVYSLREMRIYLDTHPIPDIIILDLGLPDNPYETTMDAVKSFYPDIPVVVMSGSNEADRAVAQGAKDFILKGAYSPEQINAILHKAIVRPTFKTLVEDPINEIKQIVKDMELRNV